MFWWSPETYELLETKDSNPFSDPPPIFKYIALHKEEALFLLLLIIKLHISSVTVGIIRFVRNLFKCFGTMDR